MTAGETERPDSTGRQVTFHTVLTGGYGLRDTIAGFDWLAEKMHAATQIVVWLNEFLGPIEVDGKGLEEMKVHLRRRHRIAALLKLPKQNEQTFGGGDPHLLGDRPELVEELLFLPPPNTGGQLVKAGTGTCCPEEKTAPGVRPHLPGW